MAKLKPRSAGEQQSARAAAGFGEFLKGLPQKGGAKKSDHPPGGRSKKTGGQRKKQGFVRFMRGR